MQLMIDCSYPPSNFCTSKQMHHALEKMKKTTLQ